MSTPVEREYERLHQRELAARRKILRDVETLTAIEALAELQPSMSVEQFELSRRARLFFGVTDDAHRELFPAFQFAGGRPKPIIQEILNLLSSPTSKPYQESPYSDWAAFYWFVAANAWLEDRTPLELLDEDPATVLAAAAHARDQISD